MYKGDSSGKAATRFRLWNNLATLMTLMQTEYKGAMFLSGEGGDISCLNSLGIKRNLTAVDYNEKAVALIKEKYPHVNSVFGEIGKVSKDIKYNAAHLDLCGRLSIDNILTLADVMENMEKPGVIILTMLKGRERKGGNTLDLFKGINRQVRREYMNRFRKTDKSTVINYLCKSKEFDPKVLIELCFNLYLEGRSMLNNHLICLEKLYKNGFSSIDPKEYKKNPVNSFSKGFIRTEAMKIAAMIICEIRDLQRLWDANDYKKYNKMYGDCDWIAVVSSTITYHSKTKSNGGTPFVSSSIVIGDSKFSKKYCSSENFTRTCILEHMDQETSLHQIRTLSLMLSEQGIPTKKIAEMFKISSAKIGAWKAVETMGSSKHKSVKATMKVASASTVMQRSLFDKSRLAVRDWEDSSKNQPIDQAGEMIRGLISQAGLNEEEEKEALRNLIEFERRAIRSPKDSVMIKVIDEDDSQDKFHEFISSNKSCQKYKSAGSVFFKNYGWGYVSMSEDGMIGLDYSDTNLVI